VVDSPQVPLLSAVVNNDLLASLPEAYEGLVNSVTEVLRSYEALPYFELVEEGREPGGVLTVKYLVGV